MQNLTSRVTEYRRRIRSTTVFDTIIERQPLQNNDPSHYTFGDDVHMSSKFNTDDFNDNLMEDIDKTYAMSDSSCFINNDDEAQKEIENDQCDDDDDNDLCSFISLESESSSVCDGEDEVLENNDEEDHLPPTSIHLAATLVQFMHRHRLTRACINDLCQLLRTLNIENVPKSFSAIKRTLMPDNAATKGKEYTICTECNKLSSKHK